jgi:hypothetical protein
MSTIQPSSLTNDELLRHAEHLMFTDADVKGLPTQWQITILTRFRNLLDLLDSNAKQYK